MARTNKRKPIVPSGSKSGGSAAQQRRRQQARPAVVEAGKQYEEEEVCVAFMGAVAFATQRDAFDWLAAQGQRFRRKSRSHELTTERAMAARDYADAVGAVTVKLRKVGFGADPVDLHEEIKSQLAAQAAAYADEFGEAEDEVDDEEEEEWPEAEGEVEAPAPEESAPEVGGGGGEE